MKSLLIKLDACTPAIFLAGDRSWPEIYASCDRGDWLLWLFAMVNPFDVRKRILAAAHCVNTVRHLMKDKRALAITDAAIGYGEGLIGIDKLVAEVNKGINNYATNAEYAGYYAASGAPHAVTAAVRAACDAEIKGMALYDYIAIRSKYSKITADICRKYLPFEIWKIK